MFYQEEKPILNKQGQILFLDINAVKEYMQQKKAEVVEIAKKARINVPKLNDATGLVTCQIDLSCSDVWEEMEVDRKYLVPKPSYDNLDYNPFDYKEVKDLSGKSYSIDGEKDLFFNDKAHFDAYKAHWEAQAQFSNVENS